MKVSWICGLAAVLLTAGGAPAQNRDNDYERSCRQEVANRFSVRRHDVATQSQEERHGKIRVSWTFNQRNGYCEYDIRMNLVNFKEYGEGHDDRNDNRNDNRYSDDGHRDEGYRDRQPDISVYRVRADTSGRGTFNGDERGSVRITRGWVDTTDEASVALSGERNFKITFRGEVVRANGDREFTLRIRSSDRGDASGTATFRLNGDKNEVDSITVSGRLNGNKFDGNFSR
jgi:hypothetical protein